jgi:WD40 repeat protein
VNDDAWLSRADYSVDAAVSAEERLEVGPGRAERYVIGGLLGVGGMGEVRLAFDTLLAREVAVKVPRTPEQAARLMHEARVCARLEHPSIVPLYDAGTLADGRQFYAMRVVPGLDLGHWLERNVEPLPNRLDVVRLIARIAHALAHAHQRGIIHRDISPRNIRLGANDEVMLLDWGLAADATRGAPVGPCGTAGFMAPEVEQGAAATVASDVWSLGAVLAFCLERIPRGRVTRAVEDVVARARQAQPRDRHPDAAALAEDLEACLQDRPITWRSEGPLEWVGRQARRNPHLLVALTVGLPLTVVLALLVVLTETRARRSTEAASRKSLEASLSLGAAAAASLLRQGLDAEARRVTDELLELAPDRRAPALGGLLAATAHAPRARLVPLAEPRCEPVIDPRTHARFCKQGGVLSPRHIDTVFAASLPSGGGVSFDDSPTPRRLVSVLDADGSTRTLETAFGGSGRLVPGEDKSVLVFSDGAVWIPRHGPLRGTQPCPEGVPLGALGLDGDTVMAVCGGRLEEVGTSVDWGVPVRGPTALLRVSDGWLVGTVHGQLAILGDATKQVVAFSDAHAGPVQALTALDAGRVLVLTSERLGVWDVRRGAWEALVSVEPQDDAIVTPARVEVLRGDQRLALRVDSPAVPPFANVSLGHGIASLAVAPDGQHVVLGLSDGAVWQVAPRAGVRAVRAGPRTAQVVKGLAFSPDGQRVLVGSAGPLGLQVLDASDLHDTAAPVDFRSRVVGFRGDVPFAQGWGPDSWSNGLSAEPLFGLSEGPRRLVSHAASASLVWLAPDGRVSSMNAQGVTTLRSTGHSLDALVALSPDGLHVAVVDGPKALVGAMASNEVMRPLDVTGPGRADSCALGPGGRLLAIGRRDGSLEVLAVESGGLVFRVTPFGARVASVAFAPEEPWLVAASWDGTARFFDLEAVLDAPP